MKEYIVLTCSNNTIVFNYRTISNEESVFVNKNGFYKDSLYYELKYYKRHEKKINEIIKTKEQTISTIKIVRLVTFKYPVALIRYFEIENVVLDFLSTLDIQDYNLFLECPSIKNIDCYYMPSGVKAAFIQREVSVNTSSLREISKEFLSQQDAFDNDTLYYKKIVKVKEDYPGLIDDLKEFLKINYNLKAIHVYTYSKELIEQIVDLVKNDESRNVVVFLHQGYDKGNFIVNNFDWLKNLSNKCKEDYTCEFRIVYANQFFKNNIFKQLTFNNLKLISILCVYVCVVSLILVKAYDYIEEISVEQLRSQLAGNISGTVEENNNYDYTVELTDDPDYVEETIEEVKSQYDFSNSSIKALKKVNKEVKGYLIVNNTEISYPVVQHSDNNYYLKRDIFKKKRYIGWIFFDYRNKIPKFDFNNIIYGHNMPNGSMFGTLKKVLNSSWRKKEGNMIITLQTEKGTYKFKIFSAYKVDYTTDYLKVNFTSSEDKEEFIKLIRGRSSFKSNVEVTSNDTILTLSTCAGGNNKRLAVHAVLMKDEEKKSE